MIRTADGELIPDVRGAASRSTGKRRNRVTGKSDSSSNNWRRGDAVPRCQHKASSVKPSSNKGHWGFSSGASETTSTPKLRGEVESIKTENLGLVPYLAFNLIVFSATPTECQELIDRINTKHYDEMDPHICSPDVPCSNILKRVLDDGTPDYEAGVHVCALDINLVRMAHGFSTRANNKSIIIPSWHSDLIDKWNSEYKSGKGMPYPINGFDLGVLRDIHVSNYFSNMDRYVSDDKKLYVMANIFGGDDPARKDQLNHFYEMNIQLIRGHVERADELKAGIDIRLKSKDIPARKLEAAGKYAAIRETFEETDKCIMITPEMAEKMFVVYDFQQPTKEGAYNRGLIFGFKRPVDVTMLLNTKRVVM